MTYPITVATVVEIAESLAVEIADAEARNAPGHIQDKAKDGQDK